MTTRLLFAATLAASLILGPAAFAQQAVKPVIAKSKTEKPAKAHRKAVSASRHSGKIKKNDDVIGEPYSAQKDDMTR